MFQPTTNRSKLQPQQNSRLFVIMFQFNCIFEVPTFPWSTAFTATTTTTSAGARAARCPTRTSPTTRPSSRARLRKVQSHRRRLQSLQSKSFLSSNPKKGKGKFFKHWLFPLQWKTHLKILATPLKRLKINRCFLKILLKKVTTLKGRMSWQITTIELWKILQSHGIKMTLLEDRLIQVALPLKILWNNGPQLKWLSNCFCLIIRTCPLLIMIFLLASEGIIQRRVIEI